jgi:phosphoenolpyruvate phosphomutase
MEAHNGLSAKIVEETGFKGIWASGLAISASLGVRDNNEASWTQILEVLEFMSDATNIPILMDGDTGFGNFNNARRLVKKLEQIKVAGVCVEDKKFPKTNSFLKNNEDSLADPYEFAGKITAMKDVQEDPDFVVVARLESFIAGLGLEDALFRANLYADAGADAILVHSKRADSKEIDEFMARWERNTPVIIVPTKYYSVSTKHFEDTGISMAIWANHNIRICINAMRDITSQIFKDQSLVNVEDKIATVSEVFKIQGNDELELAEKLYLPTSETKTQAIILAASKGEELGELTEEIPKALLSVNGKSILQRQVNLFVQNGITDIHVVAGYKKQAIDIKNIYTIENDIYATTSELYSLMMAKEALKNNTIISYGDLVYRGYLVRELLNTNEEVVIVADYNVDKYTPGYVEYIYADKGFNKNSMEYMANVNLISTINTGNANGVFIGLIFIRETVLNIARDVLDKLDEVQDKTSIGRMEIFFNKLLDKGINVRVFYTNDDAYLDINTIAELYKAGEF